MNDFPKIRQLGERSILLEFEAKIDEDLLRKMLVLKTVLQKNIVKQKVDIINTFDSLLISYPSPIEDVYNEEQRINEHLKAANIKEKHEETLFYIPVCYDEKFGLDLRYLSKEKDLSIEEIISLHSEPFYTVYFIGFLPGFLYLGGLNKKLQISRRNEPRLEVQKGAVGIGENQTGIYPQTSPGGWQIIGNSPVPLFDPKKDPPCEISAGDKLKFYPVNLEEYKEISEEVKNGNFSFKSEKYG